MKNEAPDQNAYDSDQDLTQLQLEKTNFVDAIFPIRNSHALCYDFSNYQTWEITENIDDMIELRPIPDESGK
jgi:hypothetical protein